jgi:hypothetical protein
VRALELANDRELTFLFANQGGPGADGAVFFTDTLFRVATISGGEIGDDCAIEVGVEGRACRSSAECDGSSCEGIVRNEDRATVLADGVCTGPPVEVGVGNICIGDNDCERGLVCSPFGSFADEGSCSPGWMRGGFTGEKGVELVVPGSASVAVSVSGLATVPTNARLDVRITQEATSPLRITLTNPSGTTTTFGERSDTNIVIFDEAVAVLGDESVNGVWFLTVEADEASVSGVIESVVMTFDSRFD